MAGSGPRRALLLAAAGLAGCRIGGANYLFGSLPESNGGAVGGGVIQVTGKACTTSYQPSDNGHVVYSSETYGHIYRIEARAGAVPEDVSYELDKLGTGDDTAINISPDGQWLIASTTRFGCAPTNCLALISQNVCSAEVIIDAATGTPINPDGWGAVGVMPGGDIIVIYPAEQGPHAIDLSAIVKHNGSWGSSFVLTGDGTTDYNEYPSLSSDGTKLLFDCGSNSYSGGAGTNVCEVHTDGSGFRIVHTGNDGPAGAGNWPLHKGNYSPSGALIFEGEWPDGTEIVWEFPADGSPPHKVNEDITQDGIPEFTDDNTPCVLPNGRIVSLWLGRPAADSRHEIKIMDADGENNAMLVIDQDTLDIGQGCGK
jgi:hypothetical protein